MLKQKRMTSPQSRKLSAGVLLGALLFSSSCMVGPNYRRPPAPVPPAFKEKPPDGWKEAQPNDAALKGKWWEIYNDPKLNALEEQVSISNQNVLAAEAQYRAARASVQVARSALFPSLTAGPTVGVSQGSGGVSSNQVAAANGVHTTYQIPFDASYQVDLWGSIRRNVRANAETAQATEAQLENAKLTYQADLAQDYFQLHGVDGDIALLQSTVDSYTGYLKLTQARHDSGIASGADVAQAQTQLDSAKEQLIDLSVARNQYEHAVAILIGKAPAELSIEQQPLQGQPPQVPVAFPSTLLERRPDIAISERQMAALNEQVGIAEAAYYPSLTLSAGAGLASSSFVNLFTWAGRFWSASAGLSETLFDAGKRRGQVHIAEADFDAGMANYRQTVLTAFQQVEDNMSALRVLEQETGATNETVQAAQTALDITTAQYKAGTATYLQVETQQTALFAEQKAIVDLLTRRMVASVLLVEALGGGWDNSQLPDVSALSASDKRAKN
ncbi:MAG TPA: efflux transporter outer membrane subunit [Bryobacteraceae bacterium]|nr:efflux transporter outer membrane subunit [Bryobacteraceae bacterium]